eukprot:COSAG04_NODE_3891_length_2445_cov_3.224638_4_plen_47_part_00
MEIERGVVQVDEEEKNGQDKEGMEDRQDVQKKKVKKDEQQQKTVEQ